MKWKGTNKWKMGELVFSLGIIIFFSCWQIRRVGASEKVISSGIDFEMGLFDSSENKSKEGEIKLQASGEWNPRVFKTPKIPLTNQSAIATDGTDVYLLAGTDRYFAKYISKEDRWVTLAEAPHLAYNGADLVVLGNYVYAIYGSYTKNFSRYSIASNSWVDLPETPDLMENGASLETDGTDIYVLRGASTSDFWKYNPITQKWSSLMGPPATIGAGADLVYKDGYLYSARGLSTQTFYRYKIGVGGSWATMQNIPATVGSNHSSTVLGDYIYINRDTNTNSFYRFNVGTTAWETIENLPQVAQYVGAVGVGNTATGFVYVFRGNSTYDFWKYNPRNNTFLGLIDLPNTPGTGADLIYMDNYAYFRRGNSSASLYRYNTAIGGTWTTMSNAPATFADDTRGVKAGNYLYYLRGSNTNTFYRYDPNTGVGGSWATMLGTPLGINYGGALVYPGGPGLENYIYATRGGLTNRTFMRYTIGVGETWDDAVVADLPDNAESGYGSRMVSDGTNIYYFPGSGMTKMYKYTTGNNTWNELTNIPFSTYYGTDISFYNGKIYALAGLYKSDFWEYTISTNSWRLLSPLQAYGLTEIGAYNGASITNDGNGTFYIEAGANNTRFFSYSTGSSNYPLSGSWTSATQDLSYITGWKPITIEADTLPGTGINWETRTSSDGVNWENWQSGIGTSINSTPNRYFQIRVNLTSDGIQSPILKSITLNYNGDTTAPTNPSTVVALSQQVGGVSLTSGQTYAYLAPYFSWSGQTDNQTGVAGYYVYFGLGETADPEIYGSFRTTDEYLVSEPMTESTYYLRLKTVDVAGNKSEAITAFIYTYNGVSPPTNLSQSLTSDFGLGTTDRVNIDGDRIRLSAKPGFWQQERLSPLTSTISYGSGFAYSMARNKLYILRGVNTNSFYQYDLISNVGSTLANAPGSVFYGSDLVEGPSGYLYALRGNNTNGFWRYDLDNNTWSDELAADTPQPVYYGGSLIFDGERYIYALKGNTDDTFMRYDTMTDDWEILENIDFGAPIEQINNNVYDGADLAFDGDNEIFAIQGGSRSGFAIYNITSGKWSQLQNLPVIAGAGAQIEYDSTSNAVYYVSGFAKTFFYKYSIENDSWSELAEVPNVVGGGAALKKVGNNLYLAIGGGSSYIYKFNISKNSWLTPTMNIFGGWWRNSYSRPFGTGTDIVKGDGDNYYITRGNYDNLFARYNQKTGEITKMADAPAGFTAGGDLVYENVHNKIYAITNPYYRKLFVYDVATDVWSEETSDPPPLDPADGGSMSFDGSRYIYWARGGNTNSFYKFDTQGVGTSKWLIQPNIIATVGGGGDIVAKGNFVYALRGVGTTAFLRYDIGTTTWSNVAVADLPTGMTVSNDGFLVDLGGDKLMACRGQTTTTCFEYSISKDSWQPIDGTYAPYIYAGGAGASNGNGQALIVPGNGALNTSSNGVYGYVSQNENSSFEEDGYYISPAHNLGPVYRFANIKVNVLMENNTDLTLYTRTSSDNMVWDNWVLATDKKIIGNDWFYKINSSPGQYLMVKLNLKSGDGVKTGLINDYQISYYQDEEKPINPTQLIAYSGIDKGSTLASGLWTNSTAPLFEWNPGYDGENGSGIDGYYVYFGIGETADPQVLGTYTTAASSIGVGLTSGQTYYFRMKTKDNAGNVSSGVGTSFVYKFDNKLPINPVTLVVDPPGYTATNSFNFSWTAAQDTDSEIAEYCYKTGEIGSTDTCTLDLGVSGIKAYRTGTNTFYIRAKDLAGNYSTDYITGSYYWSSVAPGAPQNLQVGVSSNTINDFSFSWAPPATYFGQQSGLRYYYSINALPTENNVNSVGLAVTYLSSGAYATQKGKNTLYVVVRDEAGNIDFNTYAQVDFYAETESPGMPINLDISDVSIKETNSWRLALSWDAPLATGSGVSAYKVYRSGTSEANCSSDVSNFNYVASTTQTSYVDTGLTQSKKYYCIRACDSTNECSAPSGTVSLYPDGRWRVAPSLETEPSALVKTKSAIVNWVTGRTASSFVKYGKKSGEYGDEVGSSVQVINHEISLSGLDPGATYYYKVLWTDEDGNTGESTESTLSTNPAPIVSGVKMSDIGMYSAYVNFTLANATRAKVLYGLTSNYGGQVELTTSTNSSEHTVKLDNLQEGLGYHLKIMAEDEEGNIFSSDDYEFETLPVPKISNVKIQQVRGASTATVRIVWESNTSISSIVNYYKVGKMELNKNQIVLLLNKKHEIFIKDLSDNSDYVFKIEGKDTMGNAAEPITVNFKTSLDLRAPMISNLKTESSVIGVGEEAKGQITVSWDTDEESSAQVEFDQGTGSDYPNKTQEQDRMTMNHVAILTDLKAGTVYHLRVVVRDSVGNEAKSYDNVVITPSATKAAINLVIDSLSKSFGFFGSLSEVVK